jgi:uncharacterized membrane protein
MGTHELVDGRDPESFADLLAIAVLTVVVGVFVFVPPLNNTPVRPVLSLVFVLFVPGYTVLSVLFPKRDVSQETLRSVSATELLGGGLGSLERLVFSFAVSVAITILLGLALGLWIPGVTRANVYIGLTVLIALGIPFAAARRSRLPPDTRMRVPYRRVSNRIQSRLASQGPSANVVTGLLAVLLIVAVVSVGVGVGSSQGGQVTELYLLSENDSGAYVPRDYPETVAEGGSESLALGITNQEGETTPYTVVVLLQEFEGDDGAGSPISETRLRTVSVTLDDNETEQIPHSIGPEVSDGSYRLTYLLYVGEPPDDPSVTNAYREVHLWIRITDPVE